MFDPSLLQIERSAAPFEATVERQEPETKEEFWRRRRLLPALPLCICLRIMMTQAAVNSDGSIRREITALLIFIFAIIDSKKKGPDK